MSEMRMSIGELKNLSNEDARFRIIERVVDMYQRLGDNEDAIAWLWKDVAAQQLGE
jgi:hypothetical protein